MNHNDAKCCGNCDSHNSYNYPTQVFCSTRYAQSKNPIVDTLWCCGFYNKVSQECYCTREAQKLKNTGKATQS